MTSEPTTIQNDALNALTAAMDNTFPEQGYWNEEEYLMLATSTNRLVEITDGYIEVLPMPTRTHQRIVLFLYRALHDFVTARSLGEVLVAALPVRLWEGKFREPDVMFILKEHDNPQQDSFIEQPDLVMEVVSPGNADHDLVTKRREYAQAGITEYWIVDPRPETITILRLEQGHYGEHGQYTRGMVATSVLLAGLQMHVDAVFDVSDAC